MNKLLMAMILVLPMLANAGNYTPEQVMQAKEHVRDTMKDPDSVKYRHLFVSGRALCGEINAKNSNGGYVGYQKFIYAFPKQEGEKPHDALMEGFTIFNSIWDDECKTHDIEVDNNVKE